MPETVEFLTGGNCAGVCIQYSVRPSFLSLDRVGTAWESSLALLTALAWRIRSMPEGRRPRILLFGGVVGQPERAGRLPEGRGPGIRHPSVDKSVFVGSPMPLGGGAMVAGPGDDGPHGVVVEVGSPQEYAALADERRRQVRAILLTHGEDPIPKFGPRLAVQRPDWLPEDGDRPPGVPQDMRYWPLFTFLLVGIDLLNADHVVPGTFDAYARLPQEHPRDDQTGLRVAV